MFINEKFHSCSYDFVVLWLYIVLDLNLSRVFEPSIALPWCSQACTYIWCGYTDRQKTVYQKETRQVEDEFDLEIVSLIHTNYIVQQLHVGVISVPFTHIWVDFAKSSLINFFDFLFFIFIRMHFSLLLLSLDECIFLAVKYVAFIIPQLVHERGELLNFSDISTKLGFNLL